MVVPAAHSNTGFRWKQQRGVKPDSCDAPVSSTTPPPTHPPAETAEVFFTGGYHGDPIVSRRPLTCRGCLSERSRGHNEDKAQ